MRVRLVLEAAEGKPERYELAGDPPAWRLSDVLPVPWPTAYGFVPGTYNQGDGEAWDVIVLTPNNLLPMTTVEGEIVGVLLRADDDHKLLVVLPGDRSLGEPPDLTRVPAQRRAAIEALYGVRAAIVGWAGRDEAVRLLTAWSDVSPAPQPSPIAAGDCRGAGIPEALSLSPDCH